MRLERLLIGLVPISLITVLLLLAGPLRVSQVSGANLATRELHTATNIAGATTTYKITMSGQSAGAVGSVRLQLCVEDPFPGEPCTGPSGLDFLGATLDTQTGMTGFSIHPSTTANELILTRVPAASVPGTVTFVLSGVANPDTAGSYFGRLETFATDDATGARHDGSGLAFSILPAQVSVQTVVPPYLLFCVGNTITAFDCSSAAGSYIDFGNFSTTKTATGQTKFIVATNAGFGYTIRVLGTTLTSGTNTITGLASQDVSRIGVSQFGLNLRANATPPTGSNVQGAGTGTVAAGYSTPNFYKFVPGDVLVSSTSPDYFRLFTVSYIVNVDSQQAAGVYVSTLQYVALATF